MKQMIRSFTLGLFTATVLMAFVYFQEETETTEDTLTNEQMINRLNENGYHILSKEEWASFQEETKEETKEETLSEESNLDNQVSKEEEQNEKETNESISEAPGQIEVTNNFILEIKPGMNSNDISRELFEANLIDDEKKFDQFLQNSGYSRAIQTGNFEIFSDMSYEDIARTITRR